MSKKKNIVSDVEVKRISLVKSAVKEGIDVKEQVYNDHIYDRQVVSKYDQHYGLRVFLPADYLLLNQVRHRLLVPGDIACLGSLTNKIKLINNGLYVDQSSSLYSYTTSDGIDIFTYDDPKIDLDGVRLARRTDLKYEISRGVPLFSGKAEAKAYNSFAEWIPAYDFLVLGRTRAEVIRNIISLDKKLWNFFQTKYRAIAREDRQQEVTDTIHTILKLQAETMVGDTYRQLEQKKKEEEYYEQLYLKEKEREDGELMLREAEHREMAINLINKEI